MPVSYNLPGMSGGRFGASDPGGTWYAARTPALPACPPLAGRRECDVCVIGGGLAGLTVALELARAGRDTVLVEASRIASAASGRNAGFVSPGFAESIFAIEDRLGLEAARELFRHSATGVAYVRNTIRDHGAEAGILTGAGYLKVIRHADPVSLQRRAERMARDYGYPLQFMGRAEVRERLATGAYHAAVHDGNAFHVDPLRYAHLMAELARSAGAQLHEQSRARRLKRAGDRWRIGLAGGEILAGEVVVATSAGKGPSRLVNRAVLPVATYIAAVASPSGAIAGAIRYGGCIADTRRASDYYRVLGTGPEQVLLWGGRITTRRSQPRRLAQALLADIAAVYPQLDDLRVEHVWTGLMGYTRHRMPLLGRLGQGLWVATGFGGHGLNTTAMAGELLASAMVRGDDRIECFSAFPATGTGGPVGRAAAQLVYWRLRLLDRLEEARAA